MVVIAFSIKVVVFLLTYTKTLSLYKNKEITQYIIKSKEFQTCQL